MLKNATKYTEGGKKMRYIKAWIDKYILRLESPSAHAAGWKYEWDFLKNGVRIEVTTNVCNSEYKNW